MKHGRDWEGAALESDVAQCGVQCPTWLPARQYRVWAFFSLDSRQLDSICADSVSIRTEPDRYGQNQAVSAELGRIGWLPKWLNLALNHVGIAEIGFEWGPNILKLSFLNFILNICCFFFVLCLLPSSFFVLWFKA